MNDNYIKALAKSSQDNATTLAEKPNKKRRIKNLLGVSVAQSTTGMTVEELKAEALQYINFGYESITLIIHDKYDATDGWYFSQTVEQVVEFLAYLDMLNIEHHVKIHTKDANNKIEDSTIDLEAWKTHHDTYVDNLCLAAISTGYIIDFNESINIVNDPALTTWVNTVISNLKTCGKAGISFARAHKAYSCPTAILSNIDVMALNFYPVVCAANNASKIEIDEIVKTFKEYRYDDIVKNIKNIYGCDVILSETGCSYYWESFESPESTNFSSFETLTDSNGESTARYIYAFIDAFKNVDIDALWFWFTASTIKEPVRDVLAHWKGETV